MRNYMRANLKPQAVASSPLKDGLISWWSFDESSGDALDSHGDNHLTDNNTVGTAAGKVSGARDFVPANTEYFSIADADIVFPTTQASWSMWLRPDNVSTSRVPFSKRSSGQNTIMFRFASAGSGQIYIANALSDAGSHLGTFPNSTFTSGNWYHVVIVFDGTQASNGTRLRAWVNGVEVTLTYTGTIPATLTDGTAAFEVGARTESGVYYDGLMDESGMWDRPLTTDEIAFLYNAGNGCGYSSL